MVRHRRTGRTPTSTIHSTTDNPVVANHEASGKNDCLSDENNESFFREMDQTSDKELIALIRKFRQPLGFQDKKEGQVYAAVISWEKQTMIKIGWSADNVKERLNRIKTKCKLPIFQRHVSQRVQGAHRVEMLVHQFLQHERQIKFCYNCRQKHREWFKTDFQKVINLTTILQTWMQRQPFDFSTGELKPKWSAALEYLEKSLSTRNSRTIQDFLEYGPAIKLSSPLNSMITATTSLFQGQNTLNISSRTRFSPSTRGCNVSSYQEKKSSSLNGKCSASRSCLHKRSCSKDAIDQLTRRLDDANGTKTQSYLSRSTRWLHAVLGGATSYNLDQTDKTGHVPGQWEDDFDKISQDCSSPDSPESQPLVDGSSQTLSGRNRPPSGSRQLQQINSTLSGNTSLSSPVPEITMLKKPDSRSSQRSKVSIQLKSPTQDKSESPNTLSPSLAQRLTSWRDLLTRAQTAPGSRTLPATPLPVGAMKQTSPPLQGSAEQLWNLSYGIKFIPLPIRPRLPS